MGAFDGLTIMIMATNEQKLLKETVYSVIQYCGMDNLSEIVIAMPSLECPAASVAQELIKEIQTVKISIYLQNNKNKVLFFAEIPFLAKSSHFVIMVADMEMDPSTLTKMLDIARSKPHSIVCGARWLKKSNVQGYSFFRRFANVVVNRAAARIIKSDGCDLFSVYQIYPKDVFDNMQFNSNRTLLYEYTLKPVSLGVEYIEIPTCNRKRTEGRANTNIVLLSKIAISFLATAIRIRIKK